MCIIETNSLIVFLLKRDCCNSVKQTTDKLGPDDRTIKRQPIVMFDKL